MTVRPLQFGCVDLGGLDDAFDWRADGFFRALRCDGTTIKGVASDAEAVAELLRRAGVLEADGPVYHARPNHEVVDAGWSSEASADVEDLDGEFERQLRQGRPADLTARLESLATQIPAGHGERVELARTRGAELNVSAPQTDSLRLFMPPFSDSDVGALGVDGAATRGWATWAEWVEPRLLVCTNDKSWGEIDRHDRRPTVVRVGEWLRDAVADGDVDRWLVKMFTEDRMFLHRVEGPAGPVYQVGPGTHRAHAARIWGLPYVLARVHVERLAKPLRPRTQLVGALWEGLCRRGLLTAGTDGERWYLRSVVADWVLSPPAMATQWNRMYERVYPGALQAVTGLTRDELVDADRWVDALLK